MQCDERNAGHRHHGHHIVHHQLIQAHAGSHGKPRRCQRRNQPTPWALSAQRRDGRHAAEQQRSLRHQHPPFAGRLPRDHAAHIIDQASRAGRIGSEGDQRIARSRESIFHEHRAHDQSPVRKIIIVGEHAAVQHETRHRLPAPSAATVPQGSQPCAPPFRRRGQSSMPAPQHLRHTRGRPSDTYTRPAPPGRSAPPAATAQTAV